ncbi:hypothetical protein ANN_12398 [Periplaneta americana]|uniref:Reverse transcriptase domain-containing protein n=1 Tax=Periplaneta americana TaxID=6978 RepID=A0ABQ8TIK8_PERAM|nr:hypothetical protein ANN_12398 [Periplaneta americana]
MGERKKAEKERIEKWKRSGRKEEKKEIKERKKQETKEEKEEENEVKKKRTKKGRKKEKGGKRKKRNKGLWKRQKEEGKEKEMRLRNRKKKRRKERRPGIRMQLKSSMPSSLLFRPVWQQSSLIAALQVRRDLLQTDKKPQEVRSHIFVLSTTERRPWPPGTKIVVARENTQTIRENTEILLEASKAIGLEVNPEKTKYMIMSRDQNIVRNGNIKIKDLSFEEVEKFKYLGATVTNINDTREEIKRTINMGNACYYSIENLLSSSLLSKNLKVRIYKTVILPVLLYGCETWTLTLREEHRFRVFENKVLRKIFGAKRDEVTGEWRKLHNTELHALYSSPDIIRNIKSRRLRWAGHVARMGESRNAYRVLVRRLEGKRPLGRPRRRWEDNIKMDLREVGYDDRDWINLAQDRDRWRAYMRAAMNLRVP